METENGNDNLGKKIKRKKKKVVKVVCVQIRSLATREAVSITKEEK